MSMLSALFAGLLFGLGLLVAGMADPGKVLAFLDLGGAWDPSLAFVMLGAIALAAPAFALARRRGVALRGAVLHLPVARRVDAPLVAGSALFGVGWGLAGICPGPAIVLLGQGLAQGAVFVLAMLAGMAGFELLRGRGK